MSATVAHLRQKLDLYQEAQTASSDGGRLFETSVARGKAQRTLATEMLRAAPGLVAAAEALPGMVEIAELAMPDSYFESDDRVCAAREALTLLERSRSDDGGEKK